MQSEVKPDVDLEALFEQQIPCGWCDSPAKFRSMVHHCSVALRPRFKCLEHLLAWHDEVSTYLRNVGPLMCPECGAWPFHDIPSYSDYREF